MVQLINALMSLRKIKRGELSDKADVSVAALSRFLNEESEMKADALLRVLRVLGADVEMFVKREVTKALGDHDSVSVSDDFSIALMNLDPISRRTTIDTLIRNLRNNQKLEVKSVVSRMKKYRDSIRTMGRKS